MFRRYERKTPILFFFIGATCLTLHPSFGERVFLWKKIMIIKRSFYKYSIKS